MAGHEIPDPADRKQVADHSATDAAPDDARHSCDPAFQHGVVVGFDGSTSSERLPVRFGPDHRARGQPAADDGVGGM